MKLSFACLVPFHFQRAKKDPSWPTVAFGAVGVGKFKKTRLLPPFYARRAFNLVHGLLCVASSSGTVQQSKEKRIVEQIERDPLVLPPPTGPNRLGGSKTCSAFQNGDRLDADDEEDDDDEDKDEKEDDDDDHGQTKSDGHRSRTAAVLAWTAGRAGKW